MDEKITWKNSTFSHLYY